MKLLTHNMLTSHVKGVKDGYPLRILAKQVVVNVVDFNSEFVSRMIPKLDWSVLKTTAQSVSKIGISSRWSSTCVGCSYGVCEWVGICVGGCVGVILLWQQHC